MATEKQLSANRQNASRSTGPKTWEGKQTVAQNARKHGVLSQQALLPDEDPSELAALRESVYESLEPEGEWEVILVDRVVQALWRLRRIGRVEVGVLASARHELVIKGGLAEASRHRRSPFASPLDDLADVITGTRRGTQMR